VIEGTARDLNVHVWAVGGMVRDVALGRPVHDLDITVNDDAGAFVEALAPRLTPRTAAPGPPSIVERFGTASVLIDDTWLDVARLRSETYAAPGALPTVAFVDRIEDDLGRRDFTVNAMALGLAGPRRGELVDPFGGLDDLARRRLRVLHDRSFIDDATRLWRGARTAALFDVVPDEGTARLIEEGARWLAPISGERLWTELRLTAERGHAGRTLALLDAWGVLRGTHQALQQHPSTARALRRRAAPLSPTLLAALLIAPLEERAAILDRFAATRAVRDAVEGTARLLAAGTEVASPELPPEFLAPLSGTPDDARAAAGWLDVERQPALQRALGRWERTRAPLDAEALTRLGVERGPALGRALEGLRRARYLGTLRDAAEARREVLRRLASGERW
jgi:tRNA nucleotidyltransferase (CCA-adding enzyme)